MFEPSRPLPTDHAFVIQLRAGRGDPRTGRAGRIEHLASGEAARFEREDELWAFVDGVLAPLEESSVPEAGRG